MIARWLLLSIAVVAFSPGFLRAQEKQTLTFTRAPDQAKMYEDVEIFRRILDRKLDPLYPRYSFQRQSTMVAPAYTLNQGQLLANYPATGAINPNWLPSAVATGVVNPAWVDLGQPAVFPNNSAYFLNEISSQQEVRHPLEGVYLKGQGVVYTATLSSLQSAAAGEPAKPVSEWESTRRQLRNEKEEAKKSEASKPPELSEVLLKVLAENGHHFSQLGENESLTIVITVHDSGAPAPKSEGSAKAKPSSEEKDASVSSKVRDLELLGDLHMKQEHYGMARDAFREAIGLMPSRKKTAVLARKLTQAYLMLSNIKEAQTALNQAVALEEEVKNTNAKPAPAATPPAAPLPIKLIVSAPKKLLDQVKEGKISFEEFRRQASVETLTFNGKQR